MKLQYFGCSAFALTNNNGISVGIDFWNKGAFPYAEDTPEELNIDSKDISRLLISHDHLDHSYVVDGVEPYYGVEDSRVTDDKNALQVDNVVIGKFNSMHFHPEWKVGEKANTVFKINMDGISIVHMGDCHGTMVDRALVEELKERIEDVDILLLPIGTPWLERFNTKEVLVDVIKVIDPKIIIPIHYWKLSDKEVFLDEIAEYVDKVIRFEKNLIEFDLEDVKNCSGKVVWSIPAGEYNR